jgi:hypothetical protein
MKSVLYVFIWFWVSVFHLLYIWLYVQFWEVVLSCWSYLYLKVFLWLIYVCVKSWKDYSSMEYRTLGNILWSFIRPVYYLFIICGEQFMIFFLWLFSPFRGHFPPVFLQQSLLRLATACQFFILSNLVASSHSLPSHLFLGFPVGLLPPRLCSGICFGILLSNIQDFDGETWGKETTWKTQA